MKMPKEMLSVSAKLIRRLNLAYYGMSLSDSSFGPEGQSKAPRSELMDELN